MKKKRRKEKIFFSFNIILSQVKETLGYLMKKETYNKKQWAVQISNSGAQEPASSYYLYCHQCGNVLLPKALEEYKAGPGENPNLVTLISNWGTLNIPSKYVDYVGCFLPWNKSHNADPNSRRFI